MSNLIINVDVKFSSGAKVKLSEDQYKRVEKFVSSMILSKTDDGLYAIPPPVRVAKHRRKKILGSKPWLPEDDEKLKQDFLAIPAGAPNIKIAKELAQRFYRTPGSLLIRLRKLNLITKKEGNIVHEKSI